jgi:hypothetical protein
MLWVKHVKVVVEIGMRYTIIVGNPQVKTPLAGTRCRWNYTIE